MSAAAATSVEPGAIAALRDALVAADFGEERLRAALGHDELFRLRDVPVYDRRLGRDPFATLARLFAFELDVDPDDAERAGVPDAFLVPAGDRVRATLRLEAYRDLVLACDRYRERFGGRLPPDHVGGVSLSTMVLANLVVRRRVRSALDVGTGSGALALVATAQSERVVAVDVNERALEYTAFNARLNRRENVEVVVGSFLEPVRGRTFELVLANPPFVISPDATYVFRDSGLRGDAVSRDLVRGLPPLLAEGGLAQLLVSWGLGEDDEWAVPVLEWTRESGCDVWLALTRLQDPLASAASWNTAEADDLGPVLDRWLAYYRKLGFAAIATGALILRRRTGAPTWARADDLRRRAPAVFSGDAVLGVLERQDFLASLAGDDDLLESVLRAEPRHRLEQTLRLRDGEYAADTATLALETGLETRLELDPVTAELVARCDGRRTLRDALASLTRDFGLPPDALPTPDDAARLVQLGFLVPVPGRDH